MVPNQNRKVRLVAPRVADDVAGDLEDVLKSGHLVQGERVYQFERAIRELLKVKSAVAVSSGTAALHLSLMSLGIGEGDVVLLPAFTFPSTANVVEQLGARVRFVDVDADTFNIQTENLKSQYRDECRVVIPVHLFGVPVDMDPIVEFSKDRGLSIIEDAACALGAMYGSRMCGAIGDIGCFSFHPRKIITTCEGGLVTSQNPELSERVMSLRDHGFIGGEGGKDIAVPGLNYRMTELHAAVGISGLKMLGQELEARRKLASLYDERLRGVPGIRMQRVPEGSQRVHQSYTVILPEGTQRDMVISKLRTMRIEATIGTYAVHLLSYYKKKYGTSIHDYPNATLLGRCAVTLPLHSGMNEADVDYVVSCLKKAMS